MRRSLVFVGALALLVQVGCARERRWRAARDTCCQEIELELNDVRATMVELAREVSAAREVAPEALSNTSHRSALQAPACRREQRHAGLLVGRLIGAGKLVHVLASSRDQDETVEQAGVRTKPSGSMRPRPSLASSARPTS